MDPQTLLDSTFFLIPSFVPKKGLDPQVSKVRENKMDQSGGNQRKNMTSVVKRLEPTVAAENGTIKTSAGFMLVDQSDQEEATENYEVLENNMKGKKEHCPTDCKNPLK